jgi:hypothetical protein
MRPSTTSSWGRADTAAIADLPDPLEATVSVVVSVHRPKRGVVASV